LTERHPHIRLAGPAQLQDLHGSGMMACAHGLQHIPLDVLDSEALELEVSGGKLLLEEGLGLGPVRHFVLPYGRFTGTVVETVRQAGFRSCCTTRNRPIEEGDRAFELPRVEAPPEARRLLQWLA
jgi:peptidoglycan/xylan/chitin deacetylase (PgdA/CDA1 family)